MLTKLECIVGPGAMVRREAFSLVGMRDPQFNYVADFEFWLRLGICGPFARIPKTLATWRSHSTTATFSANKQVLADEHIRMVKKLYSRPDLPTEVLEVRDEVFAWLYYVVGTNFAPDRTIARKYFIEAFRHCPSKLFKEANFNNLRPIFSSFVPKPLLDLLRRFRA